MADKNSLATVQALAGSTIRSARSLEEFDKSFNGRIGAPSRTHSMLVAGDQEHVVLKRLLPHQLGARVDMNFDLDGLKARIEIPFAHA